MAETWDPIAYLREKYGERRPVEDWPDEQFEEILEDDPSAMSVPAIAERFVTWPRDKRAVYQARSAIAGIMYEVLVRDCTNLCCDNERERRWIAGRIAKKLTRVCDHEFTMVSQGCKHGATSVEWCVRCGILMIDGQIYSPGPHQDPGKIVPGPRVPDGV